jgi:L,D-peptidoglycan transpeptidase YkuD (ErfK/YbiS/YcfS/YnhG family)
MSGSPVNVRVLAANNQRGLLTLGPLRLDCALGRSGCVARKREGDGATPLGRWRPRLVLYRADRSARPTTGLPVRPLRADDGWCDAVHDRNYNRSVRHPYPASAERLWRTDAVYDRIIVLDHNTRPRIQGHGSAIFIHLAQPGLTPTEGCIALDWRAMDLLLARLKSATRIDIG